MLIEGYGYTTELEGPPLVVRARQQGAGLPSFIFAAFSCEGPGRAAIMVEGATINAYTPKSGIILRQSDRQFEIGPQTIVARAPGSTSTSLWNDGFTGHTIAFAPESIERFFAKPLSRISFCAHDLLVTTFDDMPVLGHLFAAIVAASEGDSVDALMVESLGAAVLRTIAHEPGDAKACGHRFTARQARRARDYLMAHATEDVSLTDLSSELSFSVGHMLRCFKATFGVTPHQYLIRERVARAVALLDEPLSLETIAACTGFQTRVQMARVFRATLGLSPSEVRAARALAGPAPSA